MGTRAACAGVSRRAKRKLSKSQLLLGKDVYPDVLIRVINQALSGPVCDSLGAHLRGLQGAVRARDWTSAVRFVELMGVQQYPSVLDQYVNNQLIALLKKFPFTPQELPGFDPERTAWKKFQQSEHRCRRVNQRSTLLRHGVGFAYGEFLINARRYIAKILGSKPDLQLIYDLCDWGPGANVGVSGDRTNFARKFLAKRWTVTRGALSYATRAMWSNDQFRLLLLQKAEGEIVCYDYEKFVEVVRSRVELVTNNKVNFVLKTYKTHRSVASEPLLNGYLQKGVDKFMRGRLCAYGIDLRVQELNSAFARLGSLGGFNPYVTLDLSSASDSLATGICKTLLPPAWFEFLNLIRAHQYSYKGQLHSYHKFVSMGNGFCFPLQTLIFAAICHASCVDCGAPDDFRVYGDDIIVRQSQALQVVELLRYIGFKTNPDKTFITGPFRESCGTDWHSGTDIRPVYVDERLDTVPSLYKIHNSSLLRSTTGKLFEPIREYLREQCPEALRFVRPYHGSADSAFTVPLDVAMSSRHVWWARSAQHWRWHEVKTSAVPDKLEEYDPSICNMMKYLVGLKSVTKNAVPLAVRRKARVRVATVGGWGHPGDLYLG